MPILRPIQRTRTTTAAASSQYRHQERAILVFLKKFKSLIQFLLDLILILVNNRIEFFIEKVGTVEGVGRTVINT